MPVEVFHCRPSAIARICAREIGVLTFQLLPIMAVNPLVHYVRTQDLPYSLNLLQSTFWILPIITAIHACWRVFKLRSVVVQFDEDVLVRVDNEDRRGLAAHEVAAIVNTPRLLHIISGRQDYTITLHRELDRFSDLEAKLGEWLPHHAKTVPPPGRQTPKGLLASFSVQMLAALSFGWVAATYPKIGHWFPIGMIPALLLVILYSWRKSVKSDFAEPSLPSYLVP